MEYRGQHSNTVFGSVHAPGYSEDGARSSVYTRADREFDEERYVFAIDWDTVSITLYVDDVANHNLTRNSLPIGAKWAFDRAILIVLTVAVGDYFVGPPEATTVFPGSMLIDMVRKGGI